MNPSEIAERAAREKFEKDLHQECRIIEAEVAAAKRYTDGVQIIFNFAKQIRERATEESRGQPVITVSHGAPPGVALAHSAYVMNNMNSSLHKLQAGEPSSAPPAANCSQVAIQAFLVFNSGFFQSMFSTWELAAKFADEKFPDSPEIEIRETWLVERSGAVQEVSPPSPEPQKEVSPAK